MKLAWMKIVASSMRESLKTRSIWPEVCFCLVFYLFVCFAWQAKACLQAEETARNFELPNGLKIFLLEKRNLPLVNVVAAVNVGSKDETAETSGLVHVLEHCILFRGTEVRSGSEIGQEVRRHGAYFNAHTGQDLALFEISLPSEHADFALRNQKEILFNLKLTQEELDQEKAVILEEFSHMEDDPVSYATSLAYQNLFKGHPYGNPLQGNKDIIKALTVEKIEEFYRRYFVPSNCSLAVVGDFPLAAMEEKIKNAFGDVKGQALKAAEVPLVQPPEKGVELEIEMDVNKAYIVIGIVAPDYNHPDQYAMDVLTEIFGRNVNPMLNSVLRGRRHLVETLFMAYHTHKYGGAALITLTLDPKNLEAARRETINFLRRARDENFAPEDFFGEEQFYAYDYLGGSKNQIKYNASKSQERGLSIATALARYMLLSESQEVRPFLENIDKVNSSDLRKAAAKYFSRADYVVISIVPKRKN